MFLGRKSPLDQLLEELYRTGVFLAVAFFSSIIWCIPVMLLWNFLLVKIWPVTAINATQAAGIYLLAFILTRSNVIKNN